MKITLSQKLPCLNYGVQSKFDTDTGGTSNLRQRALRERRDAIANDVYRAMNDKEHMNWKFPDDPQLNFFTDFTDDYEELKAARSSIDKGVDKDKGAA